MGRSFLVKLWPTLVFQRDGQVICQLIRPSDDKTSKAMAELNVPGIGSHEPEQLLDDMHAHRRTPFGEAFGDVGGGQIGPNHPLFHRIAGSMFFQYRMKLPD